MRDFIIDACSWHVDEQADPETQRQAIERFKERYGPLLEFLQDNGLFTHEALDITRLDWQNCELRTSDFTSEGLELIMDCHDEWLDELDRGCNPAKLSLWRRRLARLREESISLLH